MAVRIRGSRPGAKQAPESKTRLDDSLFGPPSPDHDEGTLFNYDHTDVAPNGLDNIDGATEVVGIDVDARTVRIDASEADQGDGRPNAGTSVRDPMADPPVGWLVIARGPGKGNVLTLGRGLNVIGRGSTMRVSIDFGDVTISRTNHARIIYDPRDRRFLLSHGDGTNLTYLNDKLVMQPEPLESGSEIQFGETTRVRFQGLCGTEFDWRDADEE